MIGVDYKLTRFFFDRKEVIAAVDAATRRVLSKAGAFIRQRARTSLRRRKRTAAPGQPPSIHAKGGPSLKTILFGWDPSSESVVIGPVKLNAKGEDVPSLMEFGGTRIRKASRRSGPKVLKYAEHPFMGPALKTEVEAGRVAGAWAGAVKAV